MLTQIGLGSSVQGLAEHIHEVMRHILSKSMQNKFFSDLSIWRGGATLCGGLPRRGIAWQQENAFLGGVAAHEAIKLVTGQYVPLDNMAIYNAATSNVTTYKLE